MRKIKLCNTCIKAVHKDSSFMALIKIIAVPRNQCDVHKTKNVEKEREL